MGFFSSLMRGFRRFGVRKAIAILAVVGVVAVAFVLIASSQSAKSVQVEMLLARDIRPSIFASGQIIHGNEVSLTSEVIGKVKALYVAEGDAVERGGLVLAIDDEAYAAQVAQNRAAVRLREIDIERKQLAIENLQRQHERGLQLFESGLLEEDTFETAVHRLNTARIDLDSAQELLAQAGATLAQSLEQLERTRVRSPIAGVVTSLDIEVGETAITSTTNIPGSGLMVIADPSSMLTEVYVDEADISSIRVGQQAEVVAVAYPERPLAGFVEFIANTAKQQLGRRGLSFRVRIRVAEDALSEVRLKPGMSCRAEIFMAVGEEVPALPIRAIVSEDDLMAGTVQHAAYLFLPDESQPANGTVRKTTIELGRSDDEFQEVLAGVAHGDQIVVGPARTLRFLRDGEAVEVTSTAGGAGREAVAIGD